jgi:WD40 repeat protein
MLPEFARQVDQACNHFERAWRAGQRPCLEDFLAGWQGPERLALLRELVLLETHYRHAAGEVCRPEHYQARFPELDPAWFAADSPADTPTAVAGRVFGDYEVLEEIGRGGMGVVYRARQISLGRIVALKMILAGQLASPGEVQRLRREAENVAALDHPHIVPVYEVGEHDGQPFFSMKMIEGGTLAASHPDAGARASGRWAAKLVGTIARAVHHAHQRGILHRDLKPANILLDAQGEPHVTDFGLARRVEAEQGQTQTGALVGTPPYMAPEQARAEKALTVAVDIWAMGVILYKQLGGQLPFRAASPVEILRQVMDDEPVPPSRLQAAVSRDLETICLKCLAKEPARRYGSAEALADDLQRWLAGEPIAARPVGRLERVLKWVRRRPAQAALAAVSLLAALGLGVGLAVSNALISEALDERTSALDALQQQQQQTKDALKREQGATKDLKQALADLDKSFRNEQRTAHFRGILVAEREWQVNHLDRGDKLLESLGPAALRGWEWRFLKRQCNPVPHRTFVRRTDRGAPWENIWLNQDGTRFAETHADMSASIIDTSTGARVSRIPCGPQPPWDILNQLALSPDGRFLAAAGWRKERFGEVESERAGVRIFEAKSGRLVRQLFFSQHRVIGLAFSPDGTMLATDSAGLAGRYDGPTEIKLWKVATWEAIATLASHQKYPAHIQFSPDGSLINSGTQTWEVATGKERPEISFDGPGAPACYLDRSRLVVAWAGGVNIWDSTTGKLGRRLTCGPVAALGCSSDGRWLAVGGFDRIVRVLDAETGREARLIRGHTANLTNLCFLPGDRRLLSADWEYVKVWDLTMPQDSLVLEGLCRRNQFTAAFSPDGQLVASVGNSKDILLWDPATGKQVGRLQGNNKEVYDVAFSPDGRYLASAGYDGALVWDVHTRNLVHTFRPKDVRFATRVGFRPDSRRLAVARDRGVTIFDLDSGAALLSIPCKVWMCVATYSPDGEKLLTANPGNSTLRARVQVWDAETGQELLSLKGEQARVNTALFDKQGARILTASDDGTAKIWDLKGRELKRFKGHTGPVFTLALDPEEKRLATASGDGTVKIWDVATGQEVLTLNPSGLKPMGVAFSPDGCRLAASSQDGTLRIWDGTPLPGPAVKDAVALKKL